MLSRYLPLLALALILILMPSQICQAQNDFDASLEKFFQSRKLIETLSIRNGGRTLCADCLAKIDEVAPQLLDSDDVDKLIRIEGYSYRGGDVSAAMKVAKLVHDYLRDRYQIKSSLYLTGYPGEDMTGSAYRVEIVSYDKVLPVEDAKVETVIIR